MLGAQGAITFYMGDLLSSSLRPSTNYIEAVGTVTTRYPGHCL